VTPLIASSRVPASKFFFRSPAVRVADEMQLVERLVRPHALGGDRRNDDGAEHGPAARKAPPTTDLMSAARLA
jgi:hypothetical protein